MEDLPLDLLSVILSYLKEDHRVLACVCKTWNMVVERIKFLPKGKDNFLILASISIEKIFEKSVRLHPLRLAIKADVYNRFKKASGINTLFVGSQLSFNKEYDYYQRCQDVCKTFQIEFDVCRPIQQSTREELATQIIEKLKQKHFVIEKMGNAYACSRCKDEKLHYNSSNQDCMIHNIPYSAISVKYLYLDLPTLVPQLKIWINKIADKKHEPSDLINEIKIMLELGTKEHSIWRQQHIEFDGFHYSQLHIVIQEIIEMVGSTMIYTRYWDEWWNHSHRIQLCVPLHQHNRYQQTILFTTVLLAMDWNLPDRFITFLSSKRPIGFGRPRSITIDQTLSPEVLRATALFSSDSIILYPPRFDLNLLGNLVHRVMVFAKTNFQQHVPEDFKITANDQINLDLLNKKLSMRFKEYNRAMEKQMIRHSWTEVLGIARALSRFWHIYQPWHNIRSNDAAVATYVLLNGIMYLASFINPFLPLTAEKIMTQLSWHSDFKLTSSLEFALPFGHLLGSPFHLFTHT